MRFSPDLVAPAHRHAQDFDNAAKQGGVLWEYFKPLALIYPAWVHDLEQQILNLEGRQKELTAELEKPDTHNAGGAVMQLNRELLAVTEDLARVTEEWNGATVPKAEN
ncbi:MAG TPA: hypothetical protein VLK33_04445, partial [Terriglobales bacterium]|nr:hypothetical protein [Terriglobales bacterium]